MVFPPIVTPGETTVPAPRKVAGPIATFPHKWHPGAMWTPSRIEQSWSTVAPVFTMTLFAILASELITQPAITTEFAPIETPRAN